MKKNIDKNFLVFSILTQILPLFCFLQLLLDFWMDLAAPPALSTSPVTASAGACEVWTDSRGSPSESELAAAARHVSLLASLLLSSLDTTVAPGSSVVEAAPPATLPNPNSAVLMIIALLVEVSALSFITVSYVYQNLLLSPLSNHPHPSPGPNPDPIACAPPALLQSSAAAACRRSCWCFSRSRSLLSSSGSWKCCVNVGLSTIILLTTLCFSALQVVGEQHCSPSSAFHICLLLPLVKLHRNIGKRKIRFGCNF